MCNVLRKKLFAFISVYLTKIYELYKIKASKSAIIWAVILYDSPAFQYILSSDVGNQYISPAFHFRIPLSTFSEYYIFF